ncbi:glycosyltransferase family protein [Sphingobium yanoikuyae]|jgi:hypothetical protein|uniref:Uncharacterized protein n=1 Tax=Sphingobium yanoikuyae TaxID=13690 RepID=A0A085K5G2_SPHYA|nr:hypothetical protein [Sphingobium yanoikuyae]AYO79264.1 hypothetical protein EBF16_21715 [Sphingobium yanoikuyae]KFD27958.1 hypothetical protein IH86_12485 [Sphingobium yanoikuyae]MDV3481196.1 hypothetical protein [Sphingobium yanoikuyae]
MPTEIIAPLGPEADQWSAVQMWGLVNDIDAARKNGAWPNHVASTVVAATGDGRPVRLIFSRPAQTQEKGWTWDNHYQDEQVMIEFRDDAIYVHGCVNAEHTIIARMVVVFAILTNFAAKNPVSGIAILCSLGDSDGDHQILSFSSRKHHDLLIPDPYFMLTRSYEAERSYIEKHWVDVDHRDPRFYWRGAPSGMGKYENQFDSQRVQLIQFANDPRRSAHFNVRFANANGLDDDVRAALEAMDGIGKPEDQMEITRYAFNIDVDGVSSSWTGFFLKLLVGAPVLKITSDMGYRQWYYDELVADRHYAVVASDLGDFTAISDNLTKDRDAARAIGEAGRALALSFDLKSQIEKTERTIEHAISSPLSMKL